METVGVSPPQSPLVAAPPPWWLATQEQEQAPAGPVPGIPAEGWPDLHTIEYLTKLIVLGLLLLSLPWLLAKLVHSPGDAMKHAAGAAGMK
jgi:hypothetical protein